MSYSHSFSCTPTTYSNLKASQHTSKQVRDTDSDDLSENELCQPSSFKAIPRILVISSAEERQIVLLYYFAFSHLSLLVYSCTLYYSTS